MYESNYYSQFVIICRRITAAGMGYSKVPCALRLGRGQGTLLGHAFNITQKRVKTQLIYDLNWLILHSRCISLAKHNKPVQFFK